MMAYPQFSALETHYPAPRCHLLQLRSEEARKDNGLVSLEPSSLSCGNLVETGAHMLTNPLGGPGTVLGRQIDRYIAALAGRLSSLMWWPGRVVSRLYRGAPLLATHPEAR